MIRDKNIQWARQRLYIPVTSWTGILETYVSTDGTGIIVEPNGDQNFNGLQCAAGDVLHHTMEFPSFWDITKEIGVRCIWTPDTALVAADDQLLWTFLYDQADEDEVIADAATALSTAIAIDVISSTQTGQYAYLRSPRGVINADVFDEDALDGFFHFQVTATTLTSITDDIPFLLGVSFDYYPRLTVGGVNNNAQARQ